MHVRGHPRAPESTKKGRSKDRGWKWCEEISGPASVDRCHRTRPLLGTCKEVVRNALRSRAPSRLSANMVGMGYQVVASSAAGTFSDEVWMDLIALASKHGFSAPRLSLLGGYEEAYLTEEEAAGLYAALERALFAGEPAAEHIPPEADTLDRDTVRRVCHVLQQPVLKRLCRAPPWR